MVVYVGTRKGLELELREVERAREGEPERGRAREGEREREREREARGEFENSRGGVGGRGLNASLKPDSADYASVDSIQLAQALRQWMEKEKREERHEEQLTSIRLDLQTVSVRCIVYAKSPFGNIPCAHI